MARSMESYEMKRSTAGTEALRTYISIFMLLLFLFGVSAGNHGFCLNGFT
jgi:hypothetical protein